MFEKIHWTHTVDPFFHFWFSSLLFVFFLLLSSSSHRLCLVLVFFLGLFSSSPSSYFFLPLLVFVLVTTVHNPGCKVASPRGKSPLVSGMAWLCPSGLHSTLCAGGRLTVSTWHPKWKSCTNSTFRKSGQTQSSVTTLHHSGTLWTILSTGPAMR